MSEKEKEDNDLKETIQAIENAKKNLEKISADEHERELARLRDKHIRDQKAIFSTGYADGLEQGINQGIKQGIEQGIDQGKNQALIEMAKKLLENNVDIEIIIKTTGLTKEQIETLSSNSNL